jgi:exocyst complex component 2
MALATDRERQVLNHYRIATLYPERWPHQDNESSDDEDEDDQAKAAVVPTRQASKLSLNSRSSYSKYRNIDRHASIRSATTDSESLVQKDEPDALADDVDEFDRATSQALDFVRLELEILLPCRCDGV